MTDNQLTGGTKPWGRLATAGLGLVALLVSQFAALMVVIWRDPEAMANLAKFNSDGVSVAILIVISTPIQVALLALFAQGRGGATNYLGLTLPRRSEVMFGIAAIAVFIVAGDTLSWLLGRAIITQFQSDIYRTATAAGWLPLLLLAVVVVGPVSEETLFRGFLFHGWLRAPRDAWPVIIATALLWSMMHVQYDWFIISQIFVSGLMLGWIRWATGSTMLTILLHVLINLEGMIETYVVLPS
jgi:membrane protease YdiL (CAAX protease family)